MAAVTGSTSTPCTVTPSADIATASDADAAAEVVHGRQRGVVEPPGVGRRDLEPGGLLEPVGGVEHVVGELAELRDGPGAQPLLGQQRGDEVGVVALLAEPVLQAHHLALVVRGQASQDRPTVG